MSTTTLHSEKKKILVPQLRFPEFEGEWKLMKLGTLSVLITKGTTPKKFVEKGIKFIKLECFDGERINPDKCLFIDELTHNKELKRSILKEGDILFAIAGATIGKVNIVTNEVLPANTNQALSIVRLKETENRAFIYHNLKSGKIRRYILDNISVGAQPNLNLEQMNNFSFYLPTLPEQQKIASFLTAIDEKIQQLSRKKELLAQYKKGVMQQLFSGKLRFKDENGEDYADWEERKLGEVLKIGSGKDYKHLEKGNIPVFGTGGYMLSVNKFLHSGETVFIGRKGTIDKPFYFDGDFWTVDTLFYTHTFKNVIPKFIYCVFQQVNWKLHNEASGVPSLSKSTIEKLTFDFPCIGEQQKIANFLSNIDAKIESTSQQIIQTQSFKKGLLQQMFV